MSRLCRWSLMFCCVNWMFLPPISTILFLVNCTDLLSDGFYFFSNLLEFLEAFSTGSWAQAVSILHKAACTKKLPDTSLSREHIIEANGIFKQKIESKLRKMSKNCQNKFLWFASLVISCGDLSACTSFGYTVHTLVDFHTWLCWQMTNYQNLLIRIWWKFWQKYPR